MVSGIKKLCYPHNTQEKTTTKNVIFLQTSYYLFPLPRIQHVHKKLHKCSTNSNK